MAEGDETDQSQKTEEPTARKLEEARKRGQVVYSREVSSWLMLFAATVIFVAAGPGIMADLSDALKVFLSEAHAMSVDGYGLKKLLGDLFLRVGAIMALPLLTLLFVGVMSGLIQTGPLLTLEPMKPDISKISLIKGFSRLFAMRSIVEFLKGLVKLVVVSAAILLVLLPYFDTLEHFVGQDAVSSLADMRTLFLKMMAAALVVLFVLAALDYVYQRHDFMQKMRMSKQELKEEFKQTEGDPMVKARLRQIRETKARQRMMAAVPEADVVITNPTHYAVALKYDPKEMAAPKMLAKGADLIAQKIRELAKEHDIPIVENPVLARALFTSMEIDQSLPQEHFKAVAEVISYVFKLKGKKV